MIVNQWKSFIYILRATNANWYENLRRMIWNTFSVLFAFVEDEEAVLQTAKDIGSKIGNYKDVTMHTVCCVLWSPFKNPTRYQFKFRVPLTHNKPDIKSNWIEYALIKTSTNASHSIGFYRFGLNFTSSLSPFSTSLLWLPQIFIRVIKIKTKRFR